MKILVILIVIVTTCLADPKKVKASLGKTWIEEKASLFKQAETEDTQLLNTRKVEGQKLIAQLKTNRKSVEDQIQARRAARTQAELKLKTVRASRTKLGDDIEGRRLQRIADSQAAETRRLARVTEAEADFKAAEERKWQEIEDQNLAQKLLFQEEIDNEKAQLRIWEAQKDTRILRKLIMKEELQKIKLAKSLNQLEQKIMVQQRKAAKAALKNELTTKLESLDKQPQGPTEGLTEVSSKRLAKVSTKGLTKGLGDLKEEHVHLHK
jgi:hypothetical protein